MVTHLSENLKEDIVNCAAKWILVPWGLYNPYSGVTNNSAESLTLSYFRTYKYVRSPKPRCHSCTYIYVHGLCDRIMGLLPASKRHFTVSPHEVFT